MLADITILLLKQLLHLLVNLGGLQVFVQRLQLVVVGLAGAGVGGRRWGWGELEWGARGHACPQLSAGHEDAARCLR